MTTLQFPSSLLLLEFFILVFTLIILTKWKKSRNLDDSKLPPGPKRLPLIGNLHQMAGGSLPHHSLSHLAKKHGPIMRLQLGEILAIVISSPPLAGEILKTHELSFPQRPKGSVLEVMSYENGGLLFSPYGDYWRQLRKVVMQEFLSMKRVMSFWSIREEEVQHAVESIKELSDQGKRPVNLTPHILSVINNIVSRAAFGGRCKYQEQVISFLREFTLLGGGFDLVDLFPSIKILKYTSGNKPMWERLHRKIDVILNYIIEEHKSKLDDSGDSEDCNTSVREDLVDVLLNLQKTNELKSIITEGTIKTLITEIFIAGTDTSSTTIEWAMLEMLLNPRIMQKAQAEVRMHLKGKTHIKESDIQSLEYLKLVVKETLRLHPPTPLMIRESVEKCQIHDYEIPANTKIWINIWAIGRDPEYWPSAEEFRPERFKDSSLDYRGSSFEYIPFGGGRRICPGINLGMTIIELLLARLLYHFDWELPDGMKPEEVDMTETFGFSSRRKNNLVLLAKPYVEFSDEHCK